ncbi:prepilin-type N-terminal cleavage/methylation domain-containing protein [Clostridium estertheticum]|uniref:PulJ/GspJ family protein n=1 Tax=Clostridium estertheticum TaxID=238834 RepID=UPI001C0A9ECD|nr:prepilin-type N-terminal cleavage/methylation domain-containing protein [Clostridium estertheticum]MBU3198424.1 prepilin-type N-terminal cleavage/methylation domain-containing protein [Clostridium estertheticum]WAG65105.1 prepilin-type N-terminal cleavage/methylation domain-containing protein [Clostridium estertheticum]
MYRVIKKTKIKGFTMLELILALAIGAMFSAIFFNFFFIHQKNLNNVVIKSKLQMDMQYSMDSFSKSAMEASRISILNGISIGESFTSQDLGQEGITFFVENVDPSLQYSYKYRVEGNNLWYIKPGSPPESQGKIICSDISKVKISPIDFKCSGIVIEIQLIGEDGKTPYTISNSMYFRNK